ncbi:MAG: NUDIX domain-containing protein [Armatimonadota bacterium]|nr:NUDIX domain-containing protein [Armatimonadota bacterium]MDR7421222.1 NUDIX domain-containing protein [Armatimonadota bacterium]MDR7452987.1 NUDIX domain-containing protein [Armatimonadota bacterium]MDR7457545.1 NUDIX domain-containing protein [Armatimonadota bacterium]MDR7496184.1 NUDIX domain-containing protein [Armatimonadota bacterium]
MSRAVEVIVRAVILSDGRVLLAHKPGAAHTFLPGGHIEPGESAAAALRRELLEELGVAATVGRFLGAVEHAWTEGGGGHEVNLLFLAHADGLPADRPPASREPHIEFFWQATDALAARRLEPRVLCEVLPAWLRGGAGWASTMAPSERFGL